ncbi:MAG: helicase-associated domain-containing protein, partial [Anaerolineaceae bacterium]
AFRWSRWATSLLKDQVPGIKEPVPGKIHLFNTGLITIPRAASRTARYQIARFCDWEERKGDDFRYRISPAGFQQASKQGLSPAQIIPLLHKFAENPLPPGILQAIEHWEKAGTTTHIQTAILLRLETAEAMEKLQRTRAARYIVEVITPTTCLIKPGSQGFIRDTLAELGYLMDIKVDV